MKKSHLIAVAFLACVAGVVSAEGPAGVPDETPTVSNKSRAQVKAELAEARRLGLVVYGERDLPVATPEQERLIAEAGKRAAEPHVAAK